MSDEHFSNKEIAIGVAVGSLIAAAAAFLIVPKKKNSWKTQLHDMYGSVSDKTQEMADAVLKKSHCLMNMSCEEPDWKDKAKTVLSDISHYLSCCKKKGKGDSCEIMGGHGMEFAVGVLGGAIVGAVAGLLIAPKPGSELTSDLTHGYEEFQDKTHEWMNSIQKQGTKFAKKAKGQTHNWLSLVQTVVNELIDQAEGVNKQATEKAKEYTDSSQERIEKALEWASVGWRLWKSLTSNR